MSREQDLKNLKELRSEIYNLYVLSQEQENLKLNCDVLNKEYNDPQMPEVKQTPANNYANLKSKYSKNWKESHVSTKKLKLLTMICLSCLLIFLVYLFAMNISGDTQLLFHFNPEKVQLQDATDIGVGMMLIIDFIVIICTIVKYRREI